MPGVGSLALSDRLTADADGIQGSTANAGFGLGRNGTAHPFGGPGIRVLGVDDERKHVYAAIPSIQDAKDPSRRAVIAYAESDDGQQWVKPELGLFAFEDVRDTNIVLVGSGIGSRLHPMALSSRTSTCARAR